MFSRARESDYLRITRLLGTKLGRCDKLDEMAGAPLR